MAVSFAAQVAIRYLKFAADNGSSDALDALAYAYSQGHGVDRDAGLAEVLWDTSRARPRPRDEEKGTPRARASDARERLLRTAARPRPSPVP